MLLRPQSQMQGIDFATVNTIFDTTPGGLNLEIVEARCNATAICRNIIPAPGNVEEPRLAELCYT